MWLFAQLTRQISENPVAPPDHASQLIVLFFDAIASITSFCYFAFFIWMLVHSWRNEPGQQYWTWIILIAQPFGAIAYFFLRFLPSRDYPTPGFLRKWRRGRELARLETAAEQIGNPHQFVQWGDALRETGQLERAKSAYERALKKDSRNIQALWGSAQVANSQKRFADVRSLTQQVLAQDPQYKFGDVSLAHGRALMELGELEAARMHFEQHVKRWRHPESLFLLAQLCVDHGDGKAARQYLVGMIQDINGSPHAIARKFGRWKRQARRLLRKLPT